MQATSTTQHSLIKNLLMLILCIGAGLFQFSYAQNGCASCKLGYPDNSNLPRSAQPFNESDVLRAFDPGPSICGKAPEYIKLWYSDEHALTLGVRRVIVKSAAGTTTTDYPITPTPASPTCVDQPLVGTTFNSGDQSGNDVAVDGGRPLRPALFITDLTVYGMNSRKGDWQQGGSPVDPSRICGTWKSAVRTVDKTRSPELVTVTPDADPAKNTSSTTWDLGGGDQPPAGTIEEGYGAVVYWKLSDLKLIPGHSYRLQFMVHDGDQNKSGGDVGDSCTTLVVPIPPASIGDFVWDDNGGGVEGHNQNGIQDAGEPGVPNITVTLYDAAGNVKATTFTDANGKYTFNNVDVSGGCTSYKVGFAPLPNKYTWTFKNRGTDATKNSKVNQGTGMTDLFTLCPGDIRTDIDAGMFNPGGVTPVRITQFSGKFDNGNSILNWNISSQEGIVSYDVQRSSDGVNFSSIGNVKVNNTASNKAYVYNDKQPDVGINYYRLKNIETTGYYTYSNAIAINAPIKGITVRAVYPNPFLNQLKVSVASENAEPVRVRILDNSGRVLKVLNFTTQKGANEFLINDLASLKAGLYVVEVKTPFTSVRSKVSK